MQRYSTKIYMLNKDFPGTMYISANWNSQEKVYTRWYHSSAKYPDWNKLKPLESYLWFILFSENNTCLKIEKCNQERDLFYDFDSIKEISVTKLIKLLDKLFSLNKLLLSTFLLLINIAHTIYFLY